MSFHYCSITLLWASKVFLTLTILPVAGFLALMLPTYEFGDTHFIIEIIITPTTTRPPTPATAIISESTSRALLSQGSWGLKKPSSTLQILDLFSSSEGVVAWDTSSFNPSSQCGGMLPCYSMPKDTLPSSSGNRVGLVTDKPIRSSAISSLPNSCWQCPNGVLDFHEAAAWPVVNPNAPGKRHEKEEVVVCSYAVQNLHFKAGCLQAGLPTQDHFFFFFYSKWQTFYWQANFLFTDKCFT